MRNCSRSGAWYTSAYGSPLNAPDLHCSAGRWPTSCSSEEGVRQGSVLGPLLFSLALDPILQHLTDADCHHVAYLDDMALDTPPRRRGGGAGRRGGAAPQVLASA